MIDKQSVINNLWVEKYRPKTLEDCVLPDRILNPIRSFVQSGEIPNLLFYGSAGTSKTTLAKCISNELGADTLFINASDESGKAAIVNSITPFASTVSMDSDRHKIVILDEADGILTAGQQVLRPMIESYSSNCRFIFTCNYIQKVIFPIQSRCVCYNFNAEKKEKPQIMLGFLKRCLNILKEEGVTDINKKALSLFIANLFPDYRRIINALQTYVTTYGKIDDGILTFANSSEIASNLYPLIKNKEFDKIRKFILESSYSQDDIFNSLFYEMVNYVDSKELQAQYVLIISKYQYQGSFATNPELNTIACLVEMMVC